MLFIGDIEDARVAVRRGLLQIVPAAYPRARATLVETPLKAIASHSGTRRTGHPHGKVELSVSTQPHGFNYTDQGFADLFVKTLPVEDLG